MSVIIIGLSSLNHSVITIKNETWKGGLLKRGRENRRKRSNQKQSWTNLTLYWPTHTSNSSIDQGALMELGQVRSIFQDSPPFSVQPLFPSVFYWSKRSSTANVTSSIFSQWTFQPTLVSFCQVRWWGCCRIHRLYLCRSERLPHRVSWIWY